MPLLDLVKNICVLFAFGCVATPLTPAPQLNSAKPTLLILEKNEGERRVVRGSQDIRTRAKPSSSKLTRKMALPRIWFCLQQRHPDGGRD
jgi:hypothetical protein